MTLLPPMSSSRFEVQLKPDRRLRRQLQGGGALALVAGCAILLHLPLMPGVRLLLLAVWLAAAVREIAARQRHAARICLLGIDASGCLYGRDRRGRRFDLELCAGSMLGARMAWLRLSFADGSHYGELLRGDPGDPDWRRLQVHWRTSHLRLH